jgi:hypothetical protein
LEERYSGVCGWWRRPDNAIAAAILYLNGGAYALGADSGHVPAWVRIYVGTETPPHNSIPVGGYGGSHWLNLLAFAEFAALLH